jgi:hypothetical protein
MYDSGSTPTYTTVGIGGTYVTGSAYTGTDQDITIDLPSIPQSIFDTYYYSGGVPSLSTCFAQIPVILGTNHPCPVNIYQEGTYVLLAGTDAYDPARNHVSYMFDKQTDGANPTVFTMGFYAWYFYETWQPFINYYDSYQVSVGHAINYNQPTGTDSVLIVASILTLTDLNANNSPTVNLWQCISGGLNNYQFCIIIVNNTAETVTYVGTGSGGGIEWLCPASAFPAANIIIDPANVVGSNKTGAEAFYASCTGGGVSFRWVDGAILPGETRMVVFDSTGSTYEILQIDEYLANVNPATWSPLSICTTDRADVMVLDSGSQVLPYLVLGDYPRQGLA